MNPGRELDALIAEKVMGLKNIRYIKDWSFLEPDLASDLTEDHVNAKARGADAVVVPFYSTDIGAAWEVVDKFKEYQLLKIYYPSQEQTLYVVSFKRGCERSAETAPHAICLAALKAVEIKI